MEDCVFCRIVKSELPASIVYEDEDVVAFHDIKPEAPVHLLVIPREHIPSMLSVQSEHAPLMGKMMTLAADLAREQGCVDGFRVIINAGRVGRQEVRHLHVHVLGGTDVLPPMLKR